jgi:hypothetical protein
MYPDVASKCQQQAWRVPAHCRRKGDLSVLIGNRAAGPERGRISCDGELEGPHQRQPCRLSRQGVHPRNSDHGLGRSRQRRRWHPKV